MNTLTQARLPVRDLLGGLAVALGATLWLLPALDVRDPSRVLSFISDLLLLAGTFVLALGVRGTGGIVGSSLTGKVALIVFGAANLVLDIVGVIVAAAPWQPSGFPVALIVNEACIAVFAIAGIVAAIMVVRARVLTRPARVVLGIVAACYAVGALATLVGSIALDQAVDVLRLSAFVLPAVMLVFGVVTLFQSKWKGASRGR